MLALPKPSKPTISHYRLFHGAPAVRRVIAVADFESRVCFCLSGVRVKLSVLLKFFSKVILEYKIGVLHIRSKLPITKEVI